MTEANVLFRIMPKLVFGSSFGCFDTELVSKDTVAGNTVGAMELARNGISTRNGISALIFK